MKTQNQLLKSVLFFFFAFTIVLTACKKDEPEPVDACAEANANHEWGYDSAAAGPQCWGSVCSNSSCGGTAQSPINITGWSDVTNLPALGLVPGTTNTHIENTGETVKFNVQPGIFTDYGLTSNGWNQQYTLGQFHFHTQSEHQVDGNHRGMEAHFVHRSVWGDDYLVISVMIEEGASNPFLAQFVNNLPQNENTSYTNDTLTYNPYNLFPANQTYYHYSGSLTTPPCSEVVTWIVLENTVEASAAEIQAFKDLMGENHRPLQDLNGRSISRVVR